MIQPQNAETIKGSELGKMIESIFLRILVPYFVGNERTVMVSKHHA